MPGHSLTLEAILHEAFEEAYSLGDVPVAILGDFNSEPGEIESLADWLPTWSVLPLFRPSGDCGPFGKEVAQDVMEFGEIVGRSCSTNLSDWSAHW